MKYLNRYIFIKTERETNRPRGSPSDAFYYFIKNSKIEVLSDDSAYGVIFKCIFKKHENWSPYFYLDSNGDLSNVTIIVIKLVLLSDTIIGTDGKPMVEWLFQTKKLEPILKKCDTTKNFKNEVETILNTSERGIQKLHRNTPILLYSNKYHYDSWNYRCLYPKLLQNTAKNSDKDAIYKINALFRFLVKRHPGCIISLGLMAMEYIVPDYRVYCRIVKPIINDEIRTIPGNETINKYDSLSLSLHSTRLKWLYNIARYDLLRLAIDTGYSQGDYHTENLLMDETRRFTMIIDFGNAVRIPNIESCRVAWLELLRNDFLDDKENLTKVHLILKSIFDANFLDNSEKSAEYTWIKSIDKGDVSIMISIHKSREVKCIGPGKYDGCLFIHYFKHCREYMYDGECVEMEKRFMDVTFYELLNYWWCK
jgi:hypothetical protein